MMRILFAIPHYYTAEGGGRHGSEGGDSAARARATRLCLAALQQTFSESQGLSDGRGGVRLHAANPDLRATITIALCTTGDSHLVPHLEGCPFNHIRTNAEPRYLGFECHKVLRSGLGRYDWFGYLEDDLRLATGCSFRSSPGSTANSAMRRYCSRTASRSPMSRRPTSSTSTVI